MTYPFLKGHGTENDFVLLPDHDGTRHGHLSAHEMTQRVRALCDRRAGIGGDGVLRVVRTAAYADVRDDGSEWFMDYRNADGSFSEMCGNGIRLFARHLVDEGLVDEGLADGSFSEMCGNGIRLFARHLVDEGLADGSAPIPVGTRDGVKLLTVDGDAITADLGSPKVLGETLISVDRRELGARHVDLGNPHAVAFVSSLDDAGPLRVAPGHDPDVFPDGVNVEFVVRRGERHVAMRVHERGSGETRSCGTGACAVMVATAVDDGVSRDSDVTYRVDVPGGTLSVTWTVDDRVLLTGPAVVVASGTTDL